MKIGASHFPSLDWQSPSFSSASAWGKVVTLPSSSHALSLLVIHRKFLPMARKITKSMNLLELMEQFPDEEKCRSTLEELRWPNGVRCPRCNAHKVHRMKTRAKFYCETCTYHFSVTSGTIFHDTHLPLRKWLMAIHLILDSKKWVSGNQMKRTIGVSYETAWYLCHRIRAAMTELDQTPLNGTVEVDERCVRSSKIIRPPIPKSSSLTTGKPIKTLATTIRSTR
jgi:transposase-like protein